jgi:hypothetical protein
VTVPLSVVYETGSFVKRIEVKDEMQRVAGEAMIRVTMMD